MGTTVADAARSLARGDLVVYPTDTLPGIAACATDRRAVERLLAAKGRPAGQPISVAVSSTEELEVWGDLSQEHRAWVRRHLPGPYTILVRPTVRALRAFPPSVVRKGDRLGLRVPDHPVARELARRGGPITATSANLHGRPPDRTVAAARRTFGTRVAAYLTGKPAPSGHPSNLVDLSGAHPVLVRRS
jgi:L-threonylcarbamoyladenylate synthase